MKSKLLTTAALLSLVVYPVKSLATEAVTNANVSQEREVASEDLGEKKSVFTQEYLDQIRNEDAVKATEVERQELEHERFLQKMARFR